VWKTKQRLQKINKGLKDKRKAAETHEKKEEITDKER
jgi:hypothetical protein